MVVGLTLLTPPVPRYRTRYDIPVAKATLLGRLRVGVNARNRGNFLVPARNLAAIFGQRYYAPSPPFALLVDAILARVLGLLPPARALPQHLLASAAQPLYNLINAEALV